MVDNRTDALWLSGRVGSYESTLGCSAGQREARAAPTTAPVSRLIISQSDNLMLMNNASRVSAYSEQPERREPMVSWILDAENP